MSTNPYPKGYTDNQKDEFLKEKAATMADLGDFNVGTIRHRLKQLRYGNARVGRVIPDEAFPGNFTYRLNAMCRDAVGRRQRPESP